MSDTDSSSELNITEQIIVGRKVTTRCEDCGFNDWQPGDTCYIIEHSHYREHICPACMVMNRGQSISYYRQNERAPAKEKETIEQFAAQSEQEEKLAQEATKVAELWLQKDFQGVQKMFDEKALAGELGGKDERGAATKKRKTGE